MVPSDARLLEAHHLEVDESALTGESFPVAKDVPPVLASDLAERRSMVYDGTTIAAGRCRAVVVATGTATEASRAAAVGRGAAPPSGWSAGWPGSPAARCPWRSVRRRR